MTDSPLIPKRPLSRNRVTFPGEAPDEIVYAWTVAALRGFLSLDNNQYLTPNRLRGWRADARPRLL
jgi:hypothetical protein